MRTQFNFNAGLDSKAPLGPHVSHLCSAAHDEELTPGKTYSGRFIAKVEHSNVIIACCSGNARDPSTNVSFFERLVTAVAVLIDLQDLIVGDELECDRIKAGQVATED